VALNLETPVSRTWDAGFDYRWNSAGRFTSALNREAVTS
jgi:hypothetical protein